MTRRAIAKLHAFHAVALELATLSPCRRGVCVGCVVFSRDFQHIHAIGYNGQRPGVPHDHCTGEAGACGCRHAEDNALAKMPFGLDKCAMIVTRAPCMTCAALIHGRNIGLVLWDEPGRDNEGLDFLDHFEIEHHNIKDVLIGSVEPNFFKGKQDDNRGRSARAV